MDSFITTGKEYLRFILEQLSEIDGITYRRMMGEYIIYHHGKIAAYLCDDRLLVKILPSTATMLPEASREAPYQGAKEMLLVDRVRTKKSLSICTKISGDDRQIPKKLYNNAVGIPWNRLPT